MLCTNVDHNDKLFHNVLIFYVFSSNFSGLLYEHIDHVGMRSLIKNASIKQYKKVFPKRHKKSKHSEVIYKCDQCDYKGT